MCLKTQYFNYVEKKNRKSRLCLQSYSTLTQIKNFSRLNFKSLPVLVATTINKVQTKICDRKTIIPCITSIYKLDE